MIHVMGYILAFQKEKEFIVSVLHIIVYMMCGEKNEK